MSRRPAHTGSMPKFLPSPELAAKCVAEKDCEHRKLFAVGKLELIKELRNELYRNPRINHEIVARCLDAAEFNAGLEVIS